MNKLCNKCTYAYYRKLMNNHNLASSDWAGNKSALYKCARGKVA